jgi:hypothetical protein
MSRGRVRKSRLSCFSCLVLCCSKVRISCEPSRDFPVEVCETELLRETAGLKGILMAGIEETNVTDTLDEGGVKKLTGTEVVTGRPLFKDFITFNAMMLVRHLRIDFLSLNELSRSEYPKAPRVDGRRMQRKRRLCA